MGNGAVSAAPTSQAAGSVYLGREYTPAYFVQIKSDPFGNDGVGQAGSTALWANYQTPDAVGNGTRASNSIGASLVKPPLLCIRITSTSSGRWPRSSPE